jgi:hypothetical protein
LWRDPERHTESQHVDAVTKMQSLGLPNEILWEELGFSPQKIARIKQLKLTEALTAPLPTIGEPPKVVAKPGAQVA